MIVEEGRLGPHDLIGYLKNIQPISDTKYKNIYLRIRVVKVQMYVYK